MSELTAEQKATIERMRLHFEPFLEERLPVLVDFCERLGFEAPYRVLNEPEVFLAPLDAWVAEQDLGEQTGQEDRVWLATRLMYYLGELLIQRFQGCWLLEDDPNRSCFGKFVVGDFAEFNEGRVDPALAAMEFMSQPVGRSLTNLVEDISSELGNYMGEH